MGSGDDAVASDGKKSKQERIRDNQRRSRARRQEYLTDLEKRLADCHSVSRDAELQRGALKELQVENHRLRELLVLAGVNTAFIDTFVRHVAEPNDSAFRQLRPRITIENGHVGSLSTASSMPPIQALQGCQRSGSCCGPESGQRSHSERSASNDALDVYGDNKRHLQAAAFLPSVPNQNQAPKSVQSAPESGFCCDSFHVPPNGPLCETSEDTMLCSVAKELIEQYCVNAEEMEIIKARLATGFSNPAMPNQGCRVNNQLLFEVLNDISSKWS